MDFLIYISEGLFSRARGPLSASIGRLALVSLIHTHAHTSMFMLNYFNVVQFDLHPSG